MSLTKKEWELMWHHVKTMEETVKRLRKDSQTRLTIEWKIKQIKEQIQSVIGQME